MGAWSHGAFDNDSAADWAGELDDAEPGDRPGLVQEALLAAVEAEDYLDGDDGSIAIAAAAVVAAVTPGGPPLDHNYGPDAATIEGLALGPELVPLALAALHRVFGEDSEWRELWEESGQLEEARGALAPVLEALERLR